MIDNLVALGKDRIAVFYQEDAFGKAVLNGVEIALERFGKKPIALATYKRNTMDISPGLANLQDSNPDAIVMVGTYAPLAKFVRESKAQGLNPLFLNVSFVGTEAFAREAAEDGEGVVITQVVPPPNRRDLPAVASYHAALAKYFPEESPNFVSLEGYITARILVEGLKRAGPDPTRAGLIAAIERMNGVNIGVGSKTAYSPSFHQAFRDVFPTVLKNGEAVVFQDWSTVVSQPANQR
jgi:ABC-type branched-subunit amino acid transport system substrate-binding protein